MIKLKLLKWIKKQNKAQKLNVKKIKLSSLTNWKIDNQQIYHISKKFFKIMELELNQISMKKAGTNLLYYKMKLAS